MIGIEAPFPAMQSAAGMQGGSDGLRRVRESYGGDHRVVARSTRCCSEMAEP